MFGNFEIETEADSAENRARRAQQDEAKRQFLIGLEQLTRRTGIVIGGCGCCGSPYLRPLEDEERGDEAGYTMPGNYALEDLEVMWVSQADTREWDRHKSKIVKPVSPS